MQKNKNENYLLYAVKLLNCILAYTFINTAASIIIRRE